MKTFSKDLYNLIKSMSAYEKRCYISASDNPNNTYKILFKSISKSQEFNDDNYRIELQKKGKETSNYSRVKNYLYADILSFLAREALNKNSIKKELREAVEGIKTLIERALISQAERLLKKSKLTALRHNLYSFYTELLNQEYLIIRSKVNAREILDSVQNLKLDLMQLSEFYKQYMNIMVTELETYHTIMGIQSLDYKDVYLDEHIDIKPIEAVFNKENFLMQDVLTVNAGYLLALREHFKNNNKGSVEILNKSLAVFKKNPSLKKNFSYKYLLILNNLADSALILKQFSITDQVLKIMQNEKNISLFDENTINDIYVNTQSRRLWIECQDDKIDLELLQHLTQDAINKEHWSIPRSGIEALFQLIATNFSQKKYSACIKLINQLLRLNRSNLETESICAIMILELIIHSEYENHELVLSKSLSLKKIKSTEKQYLHVIATFFKTLVHENFKLEHLKLQHHLFAIENVSNENNAVMTQLSNLDNWLNDLKAKMKPL